MIDKPQLHHMIITKSFVRVAETIIAAILFAACGGNGKKSVPEDGVPVINKDDIQMMPADSVIDLSRYTESWDTVYLEATDQSLVGEIQKVFYYDGLLFVGSRYSNQYSIMAFDNSGHYLNNIGHQGRAKQEYLNIYCWTVDSVSKEVLIYDCTSQRILYYDYSGNYLKDLSIPKELQNCTFVSINALRDNSVLLNCPMSSTYDEINYCNNLIAVHPDGTYQMLLPESDVTRDSGILPNMHNEFTNGELWTIPALSNRVYRITDSLNVDCMLEIGYVEMPHNTFLDFLAKYNHLQASFNTNDFLFYIYENGDYRNAEWFNRQLFIIDKSTLRCNNPDVRYGEFSFGISFGNVKGCCNEVMIYSLSPETANEYTEDPIYDNMFKKMTPQEQAFCRKVSGLENPVLLLYHINKEHFLPSGSTAEKHR